MGEGSEPITGASAAASGSTGKEEGKAEAKGRGTASTERLKRPSYKVVLRAEPGIDGVLALRAFLKTALRRYGLRCVTVEEVRE